MQIEAHITFVAKQSMVKDIFKKINREKDFNDKDTHHAIDLFKDTEEYNIMIGELNNIGVKWDEHLTKMFSQDELLESQFMIYNITKPEYSWMGGFPQPEDKYEDLCFDSSTKCPICHNGAKQNKPFYLKNIPPKKLHWLTIFWEYEHFIHSNIFDSMKTKGFTGVEFWPVLNWKDKKPMPEWKQIYINNQLPPASKNTIFPIVKEDKTILAQYGLKPLILCDCGKCGKTYPEQFIYNKNDIVYFRDFNKTFEWLSCGHRTYQQIIISNRVYRCFLDIGLIPGYFEPIRFD